MGENENNLEDNIIKTSINISKNINEGNIKNNNKIINDSLKEENQQKIEQILSKEENNIEKKLNEENKSNYNDKSNKNNDSKQTNNPNETILKLNENNINNSDLEKDSDILSLEEFKKLYNQLHLIITQNKKLDPPPATWRWKRRSWFWWMTSSTPAALQERRWTQSLPWAELPASSWPCWWTGVTGNSPSGPTTSGKTCLLPGARSSPSS